MKPEAVRKAENALRRAENSNAKLSLAGDAVAFVDAWDDLLNHLNNIEEVLKAGCRGGGPSEAWYGRFINSQRKDPLLRYLHFARNCNHHGLDTPTQTHRWQSLLINSMVIQGGVITITDQAPGPKTHMIDQWSIRLKAVTDRKFKTTCTPPKEHMGIPLTDNSPTTVAHLAMKYYRNLVVEADKLSA